ncbi:MAG: hypothetical protein R2759_17290 [Bacteroidales bacterium]
MDCGSGATLKITDNTMTIEVWIYPYNFKTYSWQNTIAANDSWSGVNSEGYVFRYGGYWW